MNNESNKKKKIHTHINTNVCVKYSTNTYIIYYAFRMICDRVIIVKREETIADIFSIYILVEASRRFEWFSVPRVKQQLTQRSAVMILIIDEAWKLAGPFQPSVKEKREEGTNASREKRKDVEYCHDFLPWFIDSKTSFFFFLSGKGIQGWGPRNSRNLAFSKSETLDSSYRVLTCTK